jgi:hypothetical protein
MAACAERTGPVLHAALTGACYRDRQSATAAGAEYRDRPARIITSSAALTTVCGGLGAWETSGVSVSSRSARGLVLGCSGSPSSEKSAPWQDVGPIQQALAKELELRY